MAAFQFNQAAAKIHFNAGTNEKGSTIRKVKTYPNVADNATADAMEQALTQLASLSGYVMIKAEKVVTEDINRY